MMPAPVRIEASPAGDQELVRALLLSLIDIHLRRTSTDTLELLERDLRTLPRAGV
jgi:hypothetical protein